VHELGAGNGIGAEFIRDAAQGSDHLTPFFGLGWFCHGGKPTGSCENA
jgi:hypothetical protein